MLTILRQGLRSLVRSPGYTASAVLTLALTGGAAGTGGAVLYEALVAPRLADRHGTLVLIEPYWTRNGAALRMPGPVYREWAASGPTFGDIAARSQDLVTVTLPDGPSMMPGDFASAALFRLLNTPFAAGRPFREGADEAVVSRATAAAHLNGVENALGRVLTVNDRPYTVVGVTARGLRFPGPEPALWLPAAHHPLYEEPRARIFNAAARLPAATSVARARAEADAVAARLAADRPDTNTDTGVRITPLAERLNEPIAGALEIVAAALWLTLAGGAAAFGNLLRLRNAARAGENWTRDALGAAPARRLMEAAGRHGPIVTAGAAGAVLFAGWATPVSGTGLFLATAAVGGAPGPAAGAVLAAASAIAVAAAGTLGARLVTRTAADPLKRGRSGARAATRLAAVRPQHGDGRPGARATTAARRPLRIACAVQGALAVVLVHAAATVYGTLDGIRTTDLGISNRNVLSILVDLRRNAPADAEAATQRIRAVVDEVRRTPGVAAAAASLGLPGNETVTAAGDVVYDDPETGARERMQMIMVPATGGYLDVFGIPLLRGRALNDRDRADTERVAVADEGAARRLFGTGEAVGRYVPGLGRRIVGVVRDVRYVGAEAPRPTVYVPLAQFPVPGVYIVARGADGRVPETAAVTEALRRADPDLAVGGTHVVGRPHPAVTAELEARTWTLGAAALLMLLQTGVTLYGGAACAAAQRTREYALRMALGADRGRIAWTAVRSSALDAGAGLLIGTAAAVAAGRWMAELTGAPESAALSGTTYAVGLVCIALLAVAAAVQPALRAARTDPAAVLADAD